MFYAGYVLSNVLHWSHVVLCSTLGTYCLMFYAGYLLSKVVHWLPIV